MTRWMRRHVCLAALLAVACRSGDPGWAGRGGSVAVPPETEPPAARDAEPPKSRPIDLATALHLATASHHDILEARARVREAGGRAAWADGALLPTLSGGLAVGQTHGTVQGSFGDIKDVQYRTVAPAGTLRLSWNVGQAIYSDLAAHRALDAAGQFAAAAEQRTLLAVTEQYLDLVEAAAATRVHEQIVPEARSLLRLAEARETQGVGTALDTERARAQAAAAEQALLAARNVRQRRAKMLAAALRLDATVNLVPVDRDLTPATLVDPARPLEAWLARAAERRPELEGLDRSRQAAEEEARAARWGAWGPELSAAGTVAGAGTNFGDVGDRESWGVFLGWTLAFGAPGRIDAADARAEQAAIVRDRFNDHLRASVAAALREVELSREALDPADREAKSAEQALAMARARFEGGMLPESDLLLAQQAADQARLRRLSAVVRHTRAQTRLLGEAGMATVETLTGAEAK